MEDRARKEGEKRRLQRKDVTQNQVQFQTRISVYFDRLSFSHPWEHRELACKVFHGMGRRFCLVKKEDLPTRGFVERSLQILKSLTVNLLLD